MLSAHPPRSGVGFEIGGVALVAVVTAASLTGLFEPFEHGNDRTGLTALAFVAAFFACGALTGRAWVLVLAVGLCVVAFFANGAEALAWLLIVLALPALLVATGAGVLLARFLPRAALVLGAGSGVVALVPVAIAGTETIRFHRAPHVPPAVQRALRVDLSLTNLCPGAETPARLARPLEHSVDVLLDELRRHPDWRADYTYYYEEVPDPVHKQITVRQLAQERLSDLDNGGQPCRDDLRRRIERALS